MRVPPFQHNAAGEKIDFCSSEGAQTLCRRIEARWREAGHTTVRCHPETLRGRGGETIGYSVRSNLVGGLPPRAVA